ncbi:MAG: hypothetical protein V4668_00095 [Patescibacteria group bacterium]
MKLIIIIQSLIIVALGYYVYLISNPKTEVVVEPPVTPIPTAPAEGEPREGYTPPTSNPPVDPLTASSSVTGHSDVGMEFPTPDEEMFSQ